MSHIRLFNFIHSPSIMRLFVSPILTLCFGLIFQLACSQATPTKDQPILLKEIPLEHVKESGQTLIDRAFGLSSIVKENQHKTNQDQTPIFLFIHGFNSAGYEWIYAIHQALALGNVYWWRWDWMTCPTHAAQALNQKLDQLAQLHPHRSIIAIGHSYGGLILTRALEQYRATSPLEAHAIAAPLAGHPSLTQRCGEDAQGGKRPVQEHVVLIQWRTHRDLDGAFQNVSFDAQQSEAAHLSVLLTRSYQGHRLGHNWSISAVLDRLKTCPKPFAEDRLMCFKKPGESEGNLNSKSTFRSAKE